LVGESALDGFLAILDEETADAQRASRTESVGDGAGARDLGVNEAERRWNTALAEEPLAFADDDWGGRIGSCRRCCSTDLLTRASVDPLT
jgi:hypothetical protein